MQPTKIKADYSTWIKTMTTGSRKKIDGRFTRAATIASLMKVGCVPVKAKASVHHLSTLMHSLLIKASL
jgi:hypothetical protein